MWSYVEKKDNPRWLWHAIDHHRGKVLAYVFGRRKDELFLQLKELLEPFGINRFYTDHWVTRRRNKVGQPWTTPGAPCAWISKSRRKAHPLLSTTNKHIK
jgi:hypothetical protein